MGLIVGEDDLGRYCSVLTGGVVSFAAFLASRIKQLLSTSFAQSFFKHVWIVWTFLALRFNGLIFYFSLTYFLLDPQTF